VYSFIIAPMFYLSGIFFPIDPMPPTFQLVVQISPFTHGVHLMQLLFWKQLSLEAILIHGGILVGFSLSLGLWASHRIRNKLIT
jgi:lipooligosaccharide transport system permease protein